MAQVVDEPEDDGDDPEDPDPSDQDPTGDAGDDASDDAEAIPCPFCHRPVHEDGDICPHCGNFVGGAGAPRRVPPIVWIGFALAMLGAVTWFVLGI